jgi:hypothetical protein
MLNRLLDILSRRTGRRNGVVLALAAAGAIVYLYGLPGRNQIQLTNQQIASVQAQAVSYRQAASLLSKTEHKNKKGSTSNGQAQDVAHSLDTALPSDLQTDVLYQQLSALASYTDVTIQSYQPTGPVAAPGSNPAAPAAPAAPVAATGATGTTGATGAPTIAGFTQDAVPLTVTGTWENCLRFLGGLYGQVQLRGNGLYAGGPVWYFQSLSIQGTPNTMTFTISGGIYTGTGS